MAPICPFQRIHQNEAGRFLPPVTDRESELTAIFAAAELAFDKAYGSREDIAA